MKVLFICHGNICRSPIGEFVFKHLSNNRYYTESRAISNEEIGNDIYFRAREVLIKNNIPFTKHSAKKITEEDFNNYDLIVCFDNNNLNNLHRLFGESNKIIKLVDFDIEDPWYTNNFDKVYKEIYDGCNSLLDRIDSDGLHI